jgi:hypothetical protein
MKFLHLHLQFAADQLCKSRMNITHLLIGLFQCEIALAAWLLMGGSPFSHGLLLVVIACLEETYILFEAIGSFHQYIALAYHIIS